MNNEYECVDNNIYILQMPTDFIQAIMNYLNQKTLKEQLFAKVGLYFFFIKTGLYYNKLEAVIKECLTSR